MALRSVMLFCLVVVVMPAFSGDPKSIEQNEFYFTRVMYTDVRGNGGPNSGSPPLGGCVGGAIQNGGIGNGGFGRGFGGAWLTDTWNADCKYMWGIKRLTNV